jgi:hypothetical protein
MKYFTQPLLFTAVLSAEIVLSGCGVTEVPKGPYSVEIKTIQPKGEETYRYDPIRANDYTYMLVDKKTGQVWECNVHETKCAAVMFLHYDSSNKAMWTSTPDDDSNQQMLLK